ncbi:MAG: hypothetical protein ACD_75C02393G0002, partial [uncultured bacterium]
MSGKMPNREAIAKMEIGLTAVSRTLSIVLSVFFLLSVFLVPMVQFACDKMENATVSLNLAGGNKGHRGEKTKKSLAAEIELRNNAILENIDLLETTLEEQSLLRKAFLPPLQYVLLRYLGQGNEKAIAGRAGWLHFAPGVSYLTGPPFLGPDQLRARAEAHELWQQPVQPDPVAAIVDFKTQLDRRGIKLIVMPVPVKAAIQPDKLSARPID